MSTACATTLDLRDLDDDDRSIFEVSGLPGWFCIRYQPELDLRTGSVTTCEALLRWQHPDFGLLRPGVALGGSRWSDEVRGIEDWAMAEVCRQAAEWDDAVAVQVALNVSPGQLTSPAFGANLDRALASSGVDPTRLAIDVPFSLVATDAGLLRTITREIADRGVAVVIDGVDGVSTAAPLQSIPASVWKIDLRSAGARRPGLHPSVAVALSGARAVRATATAKAVEDLDALEAVRAMGFDRAFGHAIGHATDPVTLRDIAQRGTIRPRPLFGPRSN